MDLNTNLINAEKLEELESIFGDTIPARPQIYIRTGDCAPVLHFNQELTKLPKLVEVLRNGKGIDIVIGSSFRWPWNRLPRQEA